MSFGEKGNSSLGTSSDVALSNPANGQALTYDSATGKWKNAAAGGGSGESAWDYGVYPRVIWTGSAWPSRASSIPAGYAGAVEYWSAADSSATSPTDRITGDIWTRMATL
ncbi:MAG: hypothetical protein WBP26_06000 [Candidatus Saccharimonadales bacterium]